MNRTVRLEKITTALRDDLQKGAEHFESTYGFSISQAEDLVREVVVQALPLIDSADCDSPWCGYLAADEGLGQVVGTCAFKSSPSSDGEVEIAYFTFPPFEGRGYGQAMARALLAIAEQAPGVDRVTACTMPEPGASTRILEKAGFLFAGERIDPEDGRVWAFEHPIRTR